MESAVEQTPAVMDTRTLKDLAKFFLLVGNGNTVNTLRSLIDQVEQGTSLEEIFGQIVDQARLQAEEEDDHFARLERWVVIAGHTHENADVVKAEDALGGVRGERGRAKKIFAKMLAKVGHVPDARTFAGNITSPYWSAEAYLEIHKVTGESVDLESASKVAEHIRGDVGAEVQAQIKAAKRQN